jgi:4-amino-4-deoxy-L-arabinose transferase-like glycosyltransferase
MSSYIDDLSSTQLYTAIVAATCGLCYGLMGTGGEQNLPSPQALRNAENDNNNNNNNNAKSYKVTKVKQQPKWYLFKYINVGVFFLFCLSVAVFLWNATSYISDNGMLTQFLVGWSLCLGYFFGFFGVFFIHDDISKDHDDEEDENEEKTTVKEG